MGRGLGILVALFSSVCFAKQTGISAFEGYVDLDADTSLYARVVPGAPDAPVVVFLNGLTQDMDHWGTTIPFLQNKNVTIVTIDLALQGRSMILRLNTNFSLLRPIVPPLVIHGGLWDAPPTFPETSLEQQSQYVSALLKKLGIEQPVILVGLSYGGGLALQMAADFPDEISMAVLAAPYVFPLPSEDTLIKQLLADEKAVNPVWNTISYDDGYDVILRGMVDTTYPMIEPEIMKWQPPFQAIAVAELVRGIRHLAYGSLLNSSFRVPLHLIVAGDDQYIPSDMLDQFWSNVPLHVRGSYLKILGSEHKMNEAVGPYLGSWLWELVSNPDYLQRPGQFLGNPVQGEAQEQGGYNRVVQLQATIPLQTWHEPAQGMPEDQIAKDPNAWLPSILNAANPSPSSP